MFQPQEVARVKMRGSQFGATFLLAMDKRLAEETGEASRAHLRKDLVHGRGSLAFLISYREPTKAVKQVGIQWK